MYTDVNYMDTYDKQRKRNREKHHRRNLIRENMVTTMRNINEIERNVKLASATKGTLSPIKEQIERLYAYTEHLFSDVPPEHHSPARPRGAPSSPAARVSARNPDYAEQLKFRIKKSPGRSLSPPLAIGAQIGAMVARPLPLSFEAECLLQGGLPKSSGASRVAPVYRPGAPPMAPPEDNPRAALKKKKEAEILSQPSPKSHQKKHFEYTPKPPMRVEKDFVPSCGSNLSTNSLARDHANQTMIENSKYKRFKY